jgi:hypothetical protein
MWIEVASTVLYMTGAVCFFAGNVLALGKMLGWWA